MVKNPLVSVIIPSFNEEKNIGDCLESITKQSYNPLQIIVVDDGSTDKTAAIIKMHQVDFLVQNHKGPALARNLGVKNAKGEILVFADSDMTFEKAFVGDLVGSIINGEYKGTFSKEEYISNWDNVWSRCWNYNQNWPSKKMIPDEFPDEGMDFRAILKSEFDKVNGFDDTGYTDTWTLAKKLEYKPHSVSGAKYFHSNPDNLGEIFLQSRWSSKREYKLGVLGQIIALVRVSLPFSILIGLYKSLKYSEVKFLIFKVVYDLGQFVGILEMIFGGKLSK